MGRVAQGYEEDKKTIARENTKLEQEIERLEKALAMQLNKGHEMHPPALFWQEHLSDD